MQTNNTIQSTNQQSTSHRRQEFLNQWQGIYNAAALGVYESSKQLNKYLSQWPDDIDWFCDSTGWPESRVKHWSNICTKLASEELLLNEGAPWARAVRALPFETQKEVLTKPLEVLVDKGEVMQMDVRNLTPELVEQVIDKKAHEVRLPAKQRAWRETKAMKVTEPPRTSEPYRIVKGRFITTGAVNISLEEFILKHKRDVMKILAEAK